LGDYRRADSLYTELLPERAARTGRKPR
jgi:hypothetical protein